MKIAPPYKLSEVRKDYAKGTWSYALGAHASSHLKYQQAVDIARVQGWNPWWIRNVSDVHAVLDGCYVDERQGWFVVDFIRLLRHFDGRWAGKPFDLLDWQIYDIIIPLFGWRRKNGTRRFRRAHIEIPKKNGKSMLCAALSAYMLMGDDESGAEIYSAAVGRDQAGIIYRYCSNILAASPDLCDEVKPIDSKKRIIYARMASFFQAMSAVAPNNEGFNIYGAFIDETHVHKDRKLYSTLRYGGDARTQPLFVDITTAGVYDPMGIGWEVHEYALRVIEATGAEKDWAFFGYVCRLTKEEESRWDEPLMGKKVNPSWGVIIDPERDAEDTREAIRKPRVLNDFKRYKRNIWMQQVERWEAMQSWPDCRGNYTLHSLQDRTCYAGIDLSLSEDIAGLSLWFPPVDDGEPHRIWVWAFVPEQVIPVRDEEYEGAYSQWVHDGYLTPSPGNVIDHEYIRGIVNDESSRFHIKRIVYDRQFMTKLAQDLDDDGFTLHPMGQGTIPFNEPTKTFGDLVKTKSVEHPGNAVLDWHVGNAQLYTDRDGRVRVMKGLDQGRGRGRVRFKVDCLVSTIMALNGWLQDDDRNSASVEQGAVIWV